MFYLFLAFVIPPATETKVFKIIIHKSNQEQMEKRFPNHTVFEYNDPQVLKLNLKRFADEVGLPALIILSDKGEVKVKRQIRGQGNFEIITKSIALIEIKTHPQNQIFFRRPDGRWHAMRGTTRFVSPALEPGQLYEYEIKIEPSGQVQKIRFKAGETVHMKGD